jgi:hypothetical protein
MDQPTRTATVLNHRGTNAGIDKVLDSEYFRPATVRLTQQGFNRRQIALGLAISITTNTSTIVTLAKPSSSAD